MTDSSKPLILVIDDEEALRDGCRQALGKSGYEVLTAKDGDDGIHIAREYNPALALIDLKMPGLSGMEIIEILSKEMPDIVLIMITGYASIMSAVEAIQKGAYDYLPKPFSPEQLRVIVHRALEHRNLRMEAQKLKEEKDRMEKIFITFVSHEMRSPLVAIRQCLESMNVIAEDRLDDQIKELMARCNRRIQQLEDMVEHWLDITRIEEGTFVQDKGPLALDDIIARSAEEMRPICKSKNIDLEAHIPDNLPKIIGDEESIVRVIANVVGNATKYTPDGGKITISARNDEQYSTICVSDTGCGIPQDKLPFVFDPFFRVKGKDDVQRGSGLGLTYCKRIMESHDGQIEVDSKEGEGTTFTLKFPAMQGSA